MSESEKKLGDKAYVYRNTLRSYLSGQFAILETIACVVVPDFGADNTIR